MKLGKLLQRRLGRKDPPEEKIDVIIRFKRNITRADVSSLQNMGIQITGSSQRLPIVYGRATRNQIKKLEQMPQVKKIEHAAPVKAL